MILADKIIQLRKKAGWSQEDLAERLGVSRQSVSKWEGAQSIPDLNKLLAMSQLFGVSVDYLVKDELEAEDPTLLPDAPMPPEPLRRVSLEEANTFLTLRREASQKIALGVLLCILSPAVLILLSGIAEAALLGEGLAVGLGIGVLLAMVAIAVALFITTGMKAAPFEYLEKETIETEYGVDGMVKAQKAAFSGAYTRSILLGVCLCILSAIPVVVIPLATEKAVAVAGSVCLLLCLAAAGVYFLVRAGVVWESFQKLLQEGDYTPENRRVKRTVGAVYWPIVTAVYLAVSFLTGGWSWTWVIWPVAGVLWAAVAAIARRKQS